jgi:predicted nucleic acid-binding protein
VRLDDALRGVARLGFDTSPFIYLVEQHPRYILVVREIFSRLDAGEFVGVSSVITLVEVLTQPKKAGAVLIEREYNALLLNSQHLSIDVVTHAIADRAADLRARYNLRTPDALQLATALEAGCDAFLTNDLALRRVTDLRVLALSALAL